MNNLEIKNSQNKDHVKISKFTVFDDMLTLVSINSYVVGIYKDCFFETVRLMGTQNNTLMQSYKRTPNIFYASSKSKNQSGILSIFINKPSLCRGSKSYFISKRLIPLARTKSE